MKLSVKFLLTICIVSTAMLSYAQKDLDKLIAGSKADANYLATGYISPFLKAFGAGINQGWYNTAKPHKIIGADLTLSIAMVGIPASDKTYTVNNSELSNIYLKSTSSSGSPIPASNGSGSVPTIFGSSTEPIYESKVPGANTPIPGTQFNGPAGIKNFDKFMGGRMPVPVAHLGISLPKGTELKIRWTPELEPGFLDGSIKIFGIGVMHDIKQYIPGIKMLPFDLSGLVTYSKMDISVGLDDSDPTKKAEFSVKGTTIQALISKKISVITPYAGIGYGISNASLKVTGNYTLGGVSTKDPIAVEAKNSGPRVTAGVRLKLLVFTFHVDYTLQKYSTITGGFGLSIR